MLHSSPEHLQTDVSRRVWIYSLNKFAEAIFKYKERKVIVTLNCRVESEKKRLKLFYSKRPKERENSPPSTSRWEPSDWCFRRLWFPLGRVLSPWTWSLIKSSDWLTTPRSASYLRPWTRRIPTRLFEVIIHHHHRQLTTSVWPAG